MRALTAATIAMCVASSAIGGEVAPPKVSGHQFMGLAQAIKLQIEPCYTMGDLDGTDAVRIITTLRLRFNKDGSIAGKPELVEQTGVDDANRQYVDAVAGVAIRAVSRCVPLHLPVELYEGGWDDLNFRFSPSTMTSK